MSAETVEITPETTNEIVVPASISDLEPKMQITGTVKRLELYGAFIDLGIDATGLIHISKLGGEQVNRVSDRLSEGEEVTVWVEKIDPERQQVMLTMLPPLAVDWTELEAGQVYEGTVTRLENFGAFVSIGAEKEGLVHISELSHDFIKHPGDAVKVGQEVQVKVLGFNRRKRRIDLSMKALMEKPEGTSPAPQQQSRQNSGNKRQPKRSTYEPRDIEYEEEELDAMPTAMEIAMRRALGNDAVSAVKSEQQVNRKGKKAQREEQRRAQDDLLKRTLTLQSDN